MAALVCRRCSNCRQFKLTSSRHLLKYNLSNQKKTTYSTQPGQVTVSLSNEKKINISVGGLARFADGSAVVSLGDTAVLVTAVSKQRSPVSAPSSFLPLTVDYRQKAAALGRIPTNFLRRELAPTESETLTARAIDRSVRPMFPYGFSGETQLVCSPLSLDGSNSPDVLGICAASAALTVSDIPWGGPVAAVRVANVEGQLVANPTKREVSISPLNLVVTATKQSMVVMLEGSADNILLPDFQHAIKFGVKECQVIIRGIEELASKVSKTKKEFVVTEVPEDVQDQVRALSEMRLREIFTDSSHDKISRDTAVSSVRSDICEKVTGEPGIVSEAFSRVVRQVFRDLVFERETRCDGRLLNQLREISCSVDLYRPLHGSAIFQRGQTQVLCTTTLDSPTSVLKMDPVSVMTSGLKEKNFFLHYEFPPYATGEVGRMTGAGRREIGHGALAERSLRPIIPSDLPYALRLTAEVLESNGSSSMAAVCGGSLALMDAGIAVTAPAAGVAVGLITKRNEGEIEDYRLLTDLLGIEDYLGDMDLKMAGTRKGVTGIQADIKLPGLPLKIIMEAVQAATDAKSQIIDIMNSTIHSPRIEKREHWPVVEKLEVPVHKRARVVGLGGMNLRRLEQQTGVQIMQDDQDLVMFAPNPAAAQEARDTVASLLAQQQEPQLEFGAIFNAQIVELREIGVMVTLYPGMSPVLLHNSQLDHRRIAHPSALGLEVGQEIKVKYFGRDPVSGVMRLSRKVLQAEHNR